MENDSPFRPGGSTVAIAAAGTPPTAIQIGGPLAGEITVLIYNSGTVLASVAYAPTATQAGTNAVTPTSGTPQPVIVVPPGGWKTVTVAPNQFWTATAASASTVYLTPGNGV